MSVYFGGSRNLHWSVVPLVRSVVSAVAASGQALQVGCQRGADAQVITAWLSVRRSSLVVFAVAPFSSAPEYVRDADLCGAMVHYSAGGSVAPIPARFLLRSIAAFQGCESAVFFGFACWQWFASVDQPALF